MFHKLGQLQPVPHNQLDSCAAAPAPNNKRGQKQKHAAVDEIGLEKHEGQHTHLCRRVLRDLRAVPSLRRLAGGATLWSR